MFVSPKFHIFITLNTPSRRGGVPYNLMKKFVTVLLGALCVFSALAAGCVPGVRVSEDNKTVQKIMREFKEGFLTSPTEYYMTFDSYMNERYKDGMFPQSRAAVVEDTADFRRYTELDYEQGYAIYCNGSAVRRYDVSTGVEVEEQTDFDALYYIRLMRELVITIRDNVLGVIPKNEKYSLLDNWPFYYNAYNLNFCYDVELPLGDEVYVWPSVEMNTAKGHEMSYAIGASTHNIDDDYDDEGTRIYIGQYHPVDVDRCLEAYLEFIGGQN